MKRSITFLSATISAILWVGCSETLMNDSNDTNSKTPLTGQLEESLNIWKKKEQQNPLYRYETSFSSWVGFKNTTSITVEKKSVVERLYQAYQDYNGPLDDLWIEYGANLGSHKEGSPAVTMEALYTTCLEKILTQDPKEYDIHLSFLNNGLLESCSYTPKNCIDDCSQGIHISSITFLQKPTPPEACTENFVSISLTIVDSVGKPIDLDNFYVVMKQDTLDIGSHNPELGTYTIINDLYSAPLYEQRQVIEAISILNGVHFSHFFLVSSDGCHVKKEIGLDSIVL